MRMPIEMMNVFLNRMLVVFLARVRPDSSVAKPRCMMNTRPAQSIIQTLLAVNTPAETASSAEAAAGNNSAAPIAIPVSVRRMDVDPFSLGDGFGRPLRATSAGGPRSADDTSA